MTILERIMTRNISAVVLFCAFCLVLDIPKVEVKRTSTSTVQPISVRRTSATTTAKIPMYSEEFKPTTPQYYGSRRQAATKPKPMCGLDCNKTKKRKKQVPPSQTNSDTTRYKALKLSAVEKNDTKTEFSPLRPKYSRKFNPGEISGFVPVPGPYGAKPTTRAVQKRSRARNMEELTAKESRPSPNILGNGNFEILSGGVFSEDETNEIPQGRRMGRTGRTYDNYAISHPRFQQMPYNVQSFQFPSFYQDRHQLPAHPLFFPRGAYSENHEIKF